MTTPPRPNVTLDPFIGANRDEIILRCRANKHSVPPPSEALRRGTITDHPRAVLDATLVRIETLKAHLTERIRESQDARARLVEALKANEALLETLKARTWFDVRNTSLPSSREDDVERRTSATSHRAIA